MVQDSQCDDAQPEERSQRVRRVLQDCLQRRAGGESLSDQSIIDAHPDLMPGLAEELRKLRLIAAAWQQAEHAAPVEAEADTAQRRRLQIRCPHCNTPVEMVADTPFTEITCSSCGSRFSLAGEEIETRQAASISTIGRFELVERLGVGGFGTVWKARDTELDRTVTLKVPRAGQLDRVETEQFLREARAAAQLKHPNIVGVHEVGRDGETPYIVSDLVRGVSLADWLTGQRPTAAEAARLCVTIAEALHHAHEAGVVHRDLKPANILIDGDAQPHIMDFGLAKRDVGELTLTTDGQVLGTPAYMSPEQAEGKAHQVDGRSDVYSLGVILFELLTGERPFRGNARMLVHQVINDEPPVPRKLNGTIPRDLETICLKCLEKARDRRYGTAQQLADDLKRFLEDRPIKARRIGKAERLWRWTRRNPLIAGLSTTASLLLLAVAVVATVGYVQTSTALEGVRQREADLEEALDRESQQRKAAQKAEQEALRNSQMARDAVDRFFTRVSEDPRLKAQGLEKLRSSLLEAAREFYEQFVNQKPDDPQLRAGHALAYSRLGSINIQLGQFEKAEAAHRGAMAIWRDLVREQPDTWQYKYELASSLQYLAVQPAGRLDPHEAIAALTEARQLRDDLAKLRPELLENQVARLNVRNVLAMVLIQRKSLKEAEALLKETIELRKPLAQKDPQDHDLQQVHAYALLMLGLVDLYRYGSDRTAERLEEATARLQAAIQVMESLPDEYRQDHELQGRFAFMLIMAGGGIALGGRLEEAVEVLHAARRILEPLAERHPDASLPQANLAWCYATLAGAVHEQGKAPEDAAGLYAKAITKFEEVLQKDPAAAGYRQILSATYLRRAQLFETLGRQDEAEADRRRAAELESQEPSVFSRFWRALGKGTSAPRGDALLRVGKHEEAVTAYEQALKLRPKDTHVLNNLAWVLATSPVDKLRNGKRAIELATEAAKLTEYKQAYILSTLGAACAETGDFAAAVKWLEKALEVAENDAEKEALRKELDSYRAGKPWRESPSEQ